MKYWSDCRPWCSGPEIFISPGWQVPCLQSKSKVRHDIISGTILEWVLEPSITSANVKTKVLMNTRCPPTRHHLGVTLFIVFITVIKNSDLKAEQSLCFWLKLCISFSGVQHWHQCLCIVKKTTWSPKQSWISSLCFVHVWRQTNYQFFARRSCLKMAFVELVPMYFWSRKVFLLTMNYAAAKFSQI